MLVQLHLLHGSDTVRRDRGEERRVEGEERGREESGREERGGEWRGEECDWGRKWEKLGREQERKRQQKNHLAQIKILLLLYRYYKHTSCRASAYARHT